MLICGFIIYVPSNKVDAATATVRSYQPKDAVGIDVRPDQRFYTGGASVVVMN